MSTYKPPALDRMSEAARQRVQREVADGRDTTNPAYLYAITHVALLLAITDGLIDPIQLAHHELATRGLDHDGNWIGFPAAARLHLGNEGDQS